MKKNLIYSTLAILLLFLGTATMRSQTVTFTVEGSVTDSGKVIPNAQVTFANTDTSRVFKAKSDKKGSFIIVGVPSGTYEIEITDSSGEKLFHKKTLVPDPNGKTNGETAQFNIDVSEKKAASGSGTQTSGQGSSGQQVPKYTKEQIEEIKKQNEKAQGTNALIQQAQNAMNAKNWQEAIPPLQQLSTADPTNWQYLSALGDSYFYTGQFDQAVENYQKGIQAAETNTTVDPKNPATDPAKKKAGEAKMLTNEGNAYLKLHKNQEAVDAYTKAASMDPNPGVAFFNLCATQYNTGNVEGALAACDKAIAADPNKADAYFIKGSLLIASSTTDKEGKVTAPPGAAEALNKYLELQPDGAHAADVKQMLAYIGSKVETTYKKRGK